MFKDNSFKNSEAKKEYVKIKYAKNGWVTEQRKIPRIKIKRQEQGDFEMKERKHRALMQEIQYWSNMSHRKRKQRQKRQRHYQQEKKEYGRERRNFSTWRETWLYSLPSLEQNQWKETTTQNLRALGIRTASEQLPKRETWSMCQTADTCLCLLHADSDGYHTQMAWVQIPALTQAGVWSWQVFLGLSLLTCKMEIMACLPHGLLWR